MHPQPGEVWLADLGMTAKVRPVVIVSRYDPLAPRDLVLYVPLTSQSRPSPYEVLIARQPYLTQTSVANVQGLSSIPSFRFERKLGRLPASAMADIKTWMAFALDLDR